MERPGNFTQNARAMFISWKIFEGLCIAVYSIVVTVQELLSMGAEHVFLELFCQNLLGENFYRISWEDKTRFARSDKLDIVQFGYNQNHTYSKASVLYVWEHSR